MKLLRSEIRLRHIKGLADGNYIMGAGKTRTSYACKASVFHHRR